MSSKPALIHRVNGVLRTKRIPLEEYQIAAYYGFDSDWEEEEEEMQCHKEKSSKSRASSEVPTFRANLPSSLFQSTLPEDYSDGEEEKEEVQCHQEKGSKSRASSEMPTFRANLPSSLFQSTLPDYSDGEEKEEEVQCQGSRANSEMPTFRANLPSSLFQSTLPEDYSNGEEEEEEEMQCHKEKGSKSRASSEMPTFRANIPSSLFQSTLPEDYSNGEEGEEEVQCHQEKSIASSGVPRVSSSRLVNIFGSMNLSSPKASSKLSSAKSQKRHRQILQQRSPTSPSRLFAPPQQHFPSGHQCGRFLLHQQRFEEKSGKSLLITDTFHSPRAKYFRPVVNSPVAAVRPASKSAVILNQYTPFAPLQPNLGQSVVESKKESPRHRIVLIDEDDDDSESDAVVDDTLLEPVKLPQQTLAIGNKGPPVLVDYPDDEEDVEPSVVLELFNWSDEEGGEGTSNKENNDSSIFFTSFHMAKQLQNTSTFSAADDSSLQLSSPAPKHFCHTVCKYPSPKLSYKPSLIRPDPQSPSVAQYGLRRSKRNRLPRLQSHLGQRAIYEVDKQGNQVLVGASEVVLEDRRLKKYRVMDQVVAAEMDQEAKCRKKFTKNLMRKRRHERTQHRPKPKHQLSNVEEEEGEDEEVWDG